MAKADAQLNDLIKQFTADLTALVHEAAMASLTDALNAVDAAGSSRRSAGPKRSGARAAVAKADSSKKGVKRDPELLADLTEKLRLHIKANPGQRIEQIAAGMGTTTRELNLPAKKLIAQKKVKTKGHKRATQYFPR